VPKPPTSLAGTTSRLGARPALRDAEAWPDTDLSITLLLALEPMGGGWIIGRKLADIDWGSEISAIIAHTFLALVRDWLHGQTAHGTSA